MTVQVERLSGDGLTTVLAALYDAPQEAVAWMAEACTDLVDDDKLADGLLEERDLGRVVVADAEVANLPGTIQFVEGAGYFVGLN